MIRTGLIWSAAALTLMAGIGLWTAAQLPADGLIPTHWDANGMPDAMSTREEALGLLFILPGGALFTALLLAIAPRIDPKRGNLAKSSKAYLAIWVALMVLLTGIQTAICLSMVKGAAPDQAHTTIETVRWIIAGAAGLLIVIGNYLPKTRPSWFLGIRTPWTLSSDETWEKTHRIGGRLFMAAGVLGMIGAFVFSGIWLALQLSALVMTAALVSIVYSYCVWRTADDKGQGGSGDAYAEPTA